MSLCSHLERVSKGIVRWDVVGESNLKKFFFIYFYQSLFIFMRAFLKAMSSTSSDGRGTVSTETNDNAQPGKREMEMRFTWNSSLGVAVVLAVFEKWGWNENLVTERWNKRGTFFLASRERSRDESCLFYWFYFPLGSDKKQKKTRKTGLKAVCRVTQKFIGIEHARRLPLKRE